MSYVFAATTGEQNWALNMLNAQTSNVLLHVAGRGCSSVVSRIHGHTLDTTLLRKGEAVV